MCLLVCKYSAVHVNDMMYEVPYNTSFLLVNDEQLLAVSVNQVSLIVKMETSFITEEITGNSLGSLACYKCQKQAVLFLFHLVSQVFGFLIEMLMLPKSLIVSRQW